MIWSSLQLTSKQWIITQQFTAGADLFLKWLPLLQAIIAIASSYRFDRRSDTVWPSVCPLVGKCKILFTETCIIFKWWLLCQKLLIPSTNGLHSNIERLTMCSLNTFYVSDLLKPGINKLEFWVEFRKCIILHFLANGHPWDRLEGDLHLKL